MSKTGICPRCNKGPKILPYYDPESRESICQTCYFKVTGKTRAVKIGICSECGKGPKKIIYYHPDPEKKGNICPNCHKKFKRLEKRLSVLVKSLPVKVTRPAVKRLEERKVKYPDRESVMKALEIRAREGKENYLSNLAIEDRTLYRAIQKLEIKLLRKKGQERKPIIVSGRTNKPAKLAKTPVIALPFTLAPTIINRANKPERKAKYSTREATIETLESREIQGKENFSDVLGIEDIPLYQAALRFEVELPKKKNPPTIYYPGDLVKNRNQKDLSICERIGKVVSINDKEVRVDFEEPTKTIRVYQKWYNINNIVLHARNTRDLNILVQIPQKEVAPT